MKHIGLLTSGGDAPGMNAAIRSVVRCGTSAGFRMSGIQRGYAGLIDGDIIPLDNRAVGGIIERGGTMLRTARSEAFKTADGQRQALANIRASQLNGLVVIGGNGSLRGAQWLSAHGVPTVGIPASIDNDIPGSAMAIGVDSALNTVVDCLNRIRDTAISHERAFVVEVMGRQSGYIALMGGMAGGAEIILLPEFPVTLEQIARTVFGGLTLGKSHSIIVVAEGFVPRDAPPYSGSSARAICNYLDVTGHVDTRLTILGHLQRGGSPSALDRILATRLGEAAIRVLSERGAAAIMSYNGQRIIPVPYETLDEPCLNVDLDVLKLADVVAH